VALTRWFDKNRDMAAAPAAGYFAHYHRGQCLLGLSLPYAPSFSKGLYGVALFFTFGHGLPHNIRLSVMIEVTGQYKKVIG
jgi:hypothetical protein